MIKRRGKHGLIAVNKKFAEVKEWVNARMGKDQKIGNAVGKLRSFIIEPFIPHTEVSFKAPKPRWMNFPQKFVNY